MKIRTITIGTDLSCPVDTNTIKRINKFCTLAKDTFEKGGLEIQTLRIASQPFTEYLGGMDNKKVIEEIESLESIFRDTPIDFVSIGTIRDLNYIPLASDIISESTIISTSVTIADRDRGVDHEAARKTAKEILRISRRTDFGYGNFRFAAIANCPPHIPFFPASYHRGDACFSIGLECSDLLWEAFSQSEGLIDMPQKLKATLESKFRRIEDVAKNVETIGEIHFKGIDVSPAPSLLESESIAFAIEKMGTGLFGAPGTLFICSMITDVLKSLDVKRCGYSGLMLPILEDFGLAKRCSQGLFDIDTILTYSSVCGTGLDCIPLPGDISENKLYAILIDTAALAIKLDKPLSARLLPIPGKISGEIAHFESPYLLDCTIPDIK